MRARRRIYYAPLFRPVSWPGYVVPACVGWWIVYRDARGFRRRWVLRLHPDEIVVR